MSHSGAYHPRKGVDADTGPTQPDPMTGQVDVSGKAPGPGGQGAGPDGSHQFGLTAAIALIVGSIIGVGIFNLPTSLAAYGPITLVSMAVIISGFGALCVLAFGPGKPSTMHSSVSMTMTFAIVSLSAVNVGLILRRERQAPWSSPVFPFLGWIILGWILTWAAVELNMLQRLLDTTSLSGGQWGTVLLLFLIAPAVAGIDKALLLRRQRAAGAGAEA